MTNKTVYTAETIQCYPIDVELLTLWVDEKLHRGNPNKNISYRIVHPRAIVREPKLAVITEEFIGQDIEDSITFGVHAIERLPDGTTRHSMEPTEEITLTLDELKLYLKGPVSLAEFTKARRGYNSRIRCNEAVWMRHFNS